MSDNYETDRLVDRVYYMLLLLVFIFVYTRVLITKNRVFIAIF